MLEHTAFSFSIASPLQALAFVVFACFTIGFFVWLVNLARKK